MRATVVFLLFVFAFSLDAKDTKKITKFNLYLNSDEIYYVLKSDNSIKHGEYKAVTNGKVLVEGHFCMGLMDSLWTQYDVTGVIRSKGWFINNKRDSIWEFFDKKGELEQKIDFSKNDVILYRTALAQNPFRILSGRDTLMSTLDRPPLFIGGTSRLLEYISEEIRIPLHKPDEKITGVVTVAFIIDSIGNTSSHRILKGIGRVCNNEALRVLKTIPEQWIPGMLDGKNVSVDYVLQIPFNANMKEISTSELYLNEPETYK